MYLTRFALKKTIAYKALSNNLFRDSLALKAVSAPSYRYFSTKSNQKKSQNKDKETSKDKDDFEATSSDDSDEEITLKAKEIRNLLKDQDDEIEVLRKRLDLARYQYKDQVQENENTVKRYKDEVNKTKEYAISKFAKDLLTFRDDLQLAIEHAEKAEIHKTDDPEQAKKDFENLFNGISMTRKVFDKTLERFNAEKYKSKGK